jgi:hypothetical protein
MLGLLAVILPPAVTASAAETDDRWPPEIRAQLSDDFLACLQHAHAVRPIQHCYAVELTRQRSAVDQAVAARIAAAAGPADADAIRHAQDDWYRATDARCTPPAGRRGSLASQTAQACFLEALVRRRIALKS